MSSRTLLAAVGDATDARTWSGIPYHVLSYGSALGVIDDGLPLETSAPAWRWRRGIWNALRLITRLECGGYQYSDAFLDQLWKPAALSPDDTLINMFQLYPSRLFARHPGPRWFYIDQTLNQVFHDYGVAKIAGRRIVADALARERDQYHAAAGVIGQSEFAARDLLTTYGLPEEKVHVAVAGANIDREALIAWQSKRGFTLPSPGEPLKLVFVGKDWVRKGLDRLLRALTLARRDGACAELVVIGLDPAALPRDLARAEGVTWAGFIDKRSEIARFLDTVGGCDVGCLLSRAEAGGISLREFACLGLVTIAPAIGGSPEYVVRSAAELVAPNAPDAAIAKVIVALAGDRARLTAMKRAAFEARETASWDDAVRIIGRLVGRPGVVAS